jgi:hypothetical protein
MLDLVSLYYEFTKTGLMNLKLLPSLLLVAMLSISHVHSQQQKANEAVAGQYIVVLKDEAVKNLSQIRSKSYDERQQMMRNEVQTILVRNGLSNKNILQVYETAILGFAVAKLTQAELEVLKRDSHVKYIEPDYLVYLPVSITDGSDNYLHDFTGSQHQSAQLSANPILSSQPGDDCAYLRLNGIDQDFGAASFGPTTFYQNAEVVLVNDGVAPTNNGCEAIQNDVAGKIALIQRGLCEFGLKAYNAQIAGAVGVIIYNNTPGDPMGMAGGAWGHLVNIPVMSMTLDAGLALVSALGSGTVMATMGQFIDINTAQCTPWGTIRVGGGLSGAGKRAWVIDTGIDMEHPDLNVNAAMSHSVILGEPFPDDLNGHGTHVAGTIAALDNGFGTLGVAAGAEVIAVKVFPDGANSTATSNVIAGMNYVAANASSGDVANYSIGGGVNQATDDAAIGVSLVCPIVISAGNDASDANFRSPQRVNGPNLYTISAMNINDHLASFSNFGNPPIDFSAPGVRIASTYKDGGYALMNGTSMAAPHFAGLLLLGPICATSTVSGDPDGIPDPIAEHSPVNIPPTDGGLIAEDQLVCYGTNPQPFTHITLPTGLTGTPEYQWQMTEVDPENAAFDDWFIVGGNSEGYAHNSPINTTTWFRRLVRVDGCLDLWFNVPQSNIVRVDPYYLDVSCPEDFSMSIDGGIIFLEGLSGLSPSCFDENCVFLGPGVISVYPPLGWYDFDPQLAGFGIHQITYQYTTEAGCSGSCYFYITVAPVSISLNNLVVNSDICYGAIQYIYAENTEVQAGGALTLIAGISIHLFPPFAVMQNANFHAWIGNDICVNPTPLVAEAPQRTEEIKVDPENDIQRVISIFPNPSQGHFTIDIQGYDDLANTSVAIYSAIGELIVNQKRLIASRQHFDISSFPAGIYMIIIRGADFTEKRKLIVQ